MLKITRFKVSALFSNRPICLSYFGPKEWDRETDPETDPYVSGHLIDDTGVGRFMRSCREWTAILTNSTGTVGYPRGIK